jgi:protein-L-isoaspartate(D-aspartate) O-methyltransferase
MTEALQLKGDEKVLEIGTGSGYQAAVLAEVVKEVYTIEIVEPLAKAAEERIKQLGYQNIKVKWGDGYQGWAEYAPFDAIIVTCAPTNIPLPLQEQLKVGGRMIIPVGEQIYGQNLVYIEKVSSDRLVKKRVLQVRFVPMTGEAEKKK